MLATLLFIIGLILDQDQNYKFRKILEQLEKYLYNKDYKFVSSMFFLGSETRKYKRKNQYISICNDISRDKRYYFRLIEININFELMSNLIRIYDLIRYVNRYISNKFTGVIGIESNIITFKSENKLLYLKATENKETNKININILVTYYGRNR